MHLEAQQRLQEEGCVVDINDIVIAGSTPTAVDRFVQSLSTSFPIKDLGRLEYFHGSEASFHSGGMTLT